MAFKISQMDQIALEYGIKALIFISQTALSLFTYTYMKFLSFLTQRLSFCSTNTVKVQVSSIFKGKKIACHEQDWIPER